MLICLLPLRNEKPTLILDILKNLASVRRFDMAVMFMSTTEKKGIQYQLMILTDLFQVWKRSRMLICLEQAFWRRLNVLVQTVLVQFIVLKH